MVNAKDTLELWNIRVGIVIIGRKDKLLHRLLNYASLSEINIYVSYNY